MRAYTPIIVLALTVVAQPPRPRVATANADEDVKALVSRQYTALGEGNVSALQTLYAPGETLTFFPLIGGRQTGAAAYVQSLDEFRTSNSIRWQGPRDLIVLPLGTTVAVTTDGFRAEGSTAPGQSLSIEGRHTAVWQRTGGQWRIVHEHVSAPWSPTRATTTPAGNAPQIVAEVLNSYQQAWTSGDAAALAALWDEDGDIGTLGTPVSTRGRQAVADFWTQTISRRRSPTTVEGSASSARGVTADIVAADGTFEYRAKSAAANAPAASIDRFSLTLHKSSDAWKIAALRIVAAR